MFSVLAMLWRELQAASDRLAVLREALSKHTTFMGVAQAAVGDVIPNSVPSKISTETAAALPNVCWVFAFLYVFFLKKIYTWSQVFLRLEDTAQRIDAVLSAAAAAAASAQDKGPWTRRPQTVCSNETCCPLVHSSVNFRRTG